MRKGIRRANRPAVRGALAVLWLLAGGGALFPLPRPAWWEVQLSLTVRGDYAVKSFETTFAGEFSYQALWQGTIEQDGMDFFLYHVKTDDTGWAIREKATLPDATRILTEKERAEKPRLRLNYIIRQGQDLWFDFDVEGIRIPINSSPEKFELVLPRSKANAADETGYSDFISKGKNLISVGEEGLERDRLEKSFSWDWKRQQWAVHEKGVFFLAGSHKVTVTVTLIRH